MRNHWYKYHNWSVGNHKLGGGSGSFKAIRVESRRQSALQPVHCQQFFTTGPCSQYFVADRPRLGEGEAGERGGGLAGDLVHTPQAAWNQLYSQASIQWRALMVKTHSTIQEGAADEVNPWLERTGWLKYLIGLDRQELMASIAEPDCSIQAITPQAIQQLYPNLDIAIEGVIWLAMDGLVRHCHETIKYRAGVFMCMEAIRTEKHQTKYQPLKPYTNTKTLRDCSLPWKQILLFIARTQRRHQWESPRYRLSSRQRRAWEVLAREAQRPQQQQEECKLSDLQTACLGFCVTLLDQQVVAHEYESTLICALAILGVEQRGWKGPGNYPSLLSAVIKVARMMVVQHAIGARGSGSRPPSTPPSRARATIGRRSRRSSLSRSSSSSSRSQSSSSSSRGQSSSRSRSRGMTGDSPRTIVPSSGCLQQLQMLAYGPVYGTGQPWAYAVDARSQGLWDEDCLEHHFSW